jgi:hypothetical protein
VDEKQQAVMQYALTQQKLFGSKVLYRIAMWSALNTFLTVTQVKLFFVCGLGLTLLSDNLGLLRPSWSPYTYAVDVVALLFFVGMGRLAVKGQDWALWTGMIVYVLDGLLMLLLHEWIGALFHLVMIRSAWNGLQAAYRLRQMSKMMSAPSPMADLVAPNG